MHLQIIVTLRYTDYQGGEEQLSLHNETMGIGYLGSLEADHVHVHVHHYYYVHV